MKNLFLLFLLSLSTVSVHATGAAMPTLYGNGEIPLLTSVQEDVPMMCTMDYNPVCGVNGTTYGNACGAGKNPIAYKGECNSYVDNAAYAKLESTKTEVLKRQFSKYSDAKLISVQGTINQRIEMVKMSRIAREIQVQKITLYTFVKNTIPLVLAERAPVQSRKRPGIENIAYMIDGVSVFLMDGKSEMETSSGSASKTITRLFGDSAIGDINADGQDDAVLILSQETGGSGVFYYAAAAIMTENGYMGTNAVFLGDRIAPQTTEIRDGQIIVNYADRKTNEAMSVSPSVGVSKYLKMVDGKLVEGKK